MKKINSEITREKLERYFDVTKQALQKAQIIIPKNTHLHKVAEDCKDMAQSYYDDAKYFKESGDWVNSFAALNYAHGYLDFGARMGVFDVEYNSKLFAVDSSNPS